MSLERGGRPETREATEKLFQTLEERMYASDAANIFYNYKRGTELQEKKSRGVEEEKELNEIKEVRKENQRHAELLKKTPLDEKEATELKEIKQHISLRKENQQKIINEIYEKIKP